jgi:3-deoxy-7-phosphoheptulonate synthase
MINGFIFELQSGIDPEDILDRVRLRARYARLVSCVVPGIAKVVPVTSSYPLASTDFSLSRSTVAVGSWLIGNGKPVIMAGPCSVENREQILLTADFLSAHGCHILRGGAFKPRTSPYTFQGLGKEGLRLLAEARAATGMPIVTEVLAPSDVELVAEYADILQVGTRNMQNFPLLTEIGKTDKPVLLKRAPWVDLNTWLHAAEYILIEGNLRVMLCERGICASEASSGRFLDLGAILRLRQLTHLPIIADPSHGTGQRSLVVPMALAALVFGADGFLKLSYNPALLPGVFPGSPSMDSMGLITRTVADLAYIWQREDLGQILVNKEFKAQAIPRAGLRFGYVANCEDADYNPEVWQAWQTFLAQLVDTGLTIQRKSLAWWEFRREAWDLLLREVYDVNLQFRECGQIEYDDFAWESIRLGEKIDDNHYKKLKQDQIMAISMAESDLVGGSVDVLLLPLYMDLPRHVGTPPPDVYVPAPDANDPGFTTAPNFAHLPVLTLPIAISSGGAPIAIQLMACRGGEERLIQTGLAIEQIVASSSATGSLPQLAKR